MSRIALSSACFFVAVSVCSLPAFALDPLGADAPALTERAGGAAAAICEFDAHINQSMLIDHPMLLAAYSGEAPKVTDGKSSPDTRKALPADSGSAGTGIAPPHTVQSLMQTGPRPPKIAARAVDNQPPEDWMRTAERPVPEPGLWAVLIAGFLGVCAMARRRIYSS